MEDLKTAIQDANIFYIHLNHYNIGNRAQGSVLDLQTQREIVKIKAINQYKTYFEENLTMTDGSTLEAFANTMNLKQQQLISILDKEMGKKLQKELNIQKLSELHQLVKKGNVSKLINESIVDGNENVQALKQALVVISECLKLLEGGSGSLGAVLLNTLKSKPTSFAQLGSILENKLNEYSVSNNYKVIKRDSLKAAQNMLYNLSYVLMEKRFKTGSDISAKGLSRLILNNLVSTSIAEGLGFTMATKAEDLLYKAHIESVGTNQVQVQVDDQISDKKVTGKKDIKIQGVTYSLEMLDQGQFSGGIKIDIGISSKFYTGQSFINLTEKDGNQSILSKSSISSGSGGTLGQAINAIFDSPVNKYLIYNYYAHGNTSPYKEQLRKMNDLILKRQILRLFSSAGGANDFNQFMLINGQIISIWDILQYALNSDLFLSSSEQGSEEQGLTLSIPDRPKIIQSNKRINDQKQSQLENAWLRSKKVNSAINTAKIKAKLHLKNLAKYYNNKN